MIYLKLFLIFLKIGAVSFGGGYSMISLIREECLAQGWLTEEEILNFIAISESTPGPIAVNMATFIGSSQGGVLGAILATIGVVLTAFVVILLIAIFIRNLLKYAAVKATLNGIRPAIIGLIIATSLILFLKVIFNLQTVNSSFSFNWKGLIIFSIVAVGSIVYKKISKRAISPIFLILISGVLGVLFYAL